MAKSEFSKFLERLFLGTEKEEKGVLERRSETVEGLDPKKQYEKIGTGVIEVVCPRCGRGYGSVTEEKCDACGSGRTGLFYREISVVNKPEDRSKPGKAVTVEAVEGFPECGSNIVRIGEGVNRKIVAGGQVVISEYSEVDFTAATERVSVGDSCKVDGVWSPKIIIGDYCLSQNIVTRNISTGVSTDLGDVVIDPNGAAEFGEYTEINTLILGKGARVTFQDSCVVGTVASVGPSEVNTGDYCEIAEEYNDLSEKYFFELRSRVINEMKS